MEFLPSRSRVVGRYRFQEDSFRKGPCLAVGDDQTASGLLRTRAVENQQGCLLGEGFQGLSVEMVPVLVGDEDDVGFREFRRIVGRLSVSVDRIDLDGQSVIGDFQGAMLDQGDTDRFAAVRREGFRFIGGRAFRLQEGGNEHQKHQGHGFHKARDFIRLVNIRDIRNNAYLCVSKS